MPQRQSGAGPLGENLQLGVGARNCGCRLIAGRQLRDRTRRRPGDRRPAPGACATTATTRTWSSRPTRARRRSGLANAIAIEYGFWLGDAFASGGSLGYDHKAMGITARGRVGIGEAALPRARHRHPDARTSPCVGIGDMSGDVFGNGMLLSRHIRLVAAFDHRHIFLDPDPDPDRRFAERSGCSTCRARRGPTTTRR